MFLQHLFFLATTYVVALSSPMPARSLPNDKSSPIPYREFGVSKLKCWEPIGIGSNLPATADCLKLAEVLPRIGTKGLFHNGPPTDYFRLPFLKTFRSCTATVSIPASSLEFSDWDMVYETVMNLAQDCSVGQFPIGKSGGVSYIGPKRKIRVTIEKLDFRSSQGSKTNLTAII